MNVQFVGKDALIADDQFEVASYVLNALAREGHDVQAILGPERIGSLSEFLRDGAQMNADRLKGILMQAIEEVSRIVLERDGRPQARLGDWELLIHCLISCRSLRDAIERMGTYFRAINGRLGFVSLHVDGSAELLFDCLHSARSPTSMVLDLLGMGSMHGLLSWLIGDLIPVSEICLPYSEEFRPYCDQRILPYPVTLGSQKTALRFPTALLDYPLIRTVDDCEAHGLDFLAEARGEGLQRDIADQARRIIYQELRDRWSLLSLDSLSERLGRNRETLRRQLKASGATYNSIKDSCRCELGLRLLRHTNLKIEDVATRLDFCDSDAFRRSFRDWVGISPSDYRRAGMPR